ncbi:sigma-54-dependent Fis family transcriptional regulator [candidate division KSB1 bacterium]|nr:sigma-54-dependent Fis family transcriptional regulator [candidate division KSB1 bacterium]
MDNHKPSVIVVDDEEHILKTIGICLDASGFETALCSKPQQALDRLQHDCFDLAFIDLKMAPIDGMEMLAEIKKCSPETAVIIITAHGSIDTAVEAIKQGAYHYLQKPFEYKELQLFAQKALEYHQLNIEVQQLRKQALESRQQSNFITKNKHMLGQLDLAVKVAESSMSILIEGESGTGKELIAQFIHDNSDRKSGAFVKVNCAALPAELLESELFGHVKGAFTGALNNRQGRFELAHDGTIFLDEIGEVSLAIQVKLLRVIQHKEFERVGESTSRKVDVRIIAATRISPMPSGKAHLETICFIGSMQSVSSRYRYANARKTFPF